MSTFLGEGFTRAWALFAYPSGHYTYDNGGGPGSGNAQADIVRNCFAFGRVYGGGLNLRSNLHAPWLVRASAPTGGPSVASGGHYEVPSRIIAAMSALGADRWFILQLYRFRSGVLAGDHNCLGPEQTHFTKFNEEYCWEDFLTILNSIPSNVVVTDPATVACAWGRLPDAGPRPQCP